MPSGIKRQFVDDLLERDLCICDRSLSATEFAHARGAVTSWKQRAGVGEVEEKAIRMGGEVRQLDGLLQEFFLRLDHCEHRRSHDREQLSSIEQELDTIREQLRHSPLEEISDLERRLSATESAIEGDLQEKGFVSSRLQDDEKRLAEIKSELEKYEAREGQQRIAKARMLAASEAMSRIGEVNVAI